jgi:hypothetical protein
MSWYNNPITMFWYNKPNNNVDTINPTTAMLWYNNPTTML